MATVAELKEENHGLREENQALKDEIARLKGQKGKPTIRPSQLSKNDRKKRNRNKHHRQKDKRPPDRIETVKAKGVPSGSVFKGYAEWTVQDLVIRPQVTLYRAEKWLTPNGKLITGKIPLNNTSASHFGPTLHSFVLYQYYHAQVTEPLILEELREWGICISSGQLHRESSSRLARRRLPIKSSGTISWPSRIFETKGWCVLLPKGHY